jgi:outer membrane cobalamin receptor
VNARVTTTIAGRLSLYVAVENILDHQYQILYDYPMPGRTAFAGLNWAMH